MTGRHRIDPYANGSWDFLKRLGALQEQCGASPPLSQTPQRKPSLWPSDCIKCVSFKEESGWNYSKGYYQQRYNWIDYWEDTTLESYLKAGLLDDYPNTSAVTLGQVASQTEDHVEERRKLVDDTVQTVAKQFDLTKLLPFSFSILSNGQLRRSRIARALLLRPQIIILDEPFS